MVFLLLPVLAMAQEKGIAFDKSASWKEVLAKAKAEKKYIFVDCFTTWCGPCKYMDAKIYPLQEVGDYYNANFINVKLQLDSTGADNEYVKGWYKDGKEIAATYGVNAYPTYLFFDPNGTIVHRFVGGSEAKDFVARAANALDPEKQYYTQLNKYKAGKNDPDFLRTLATAAMSSYDMKTGKEVADKYLATQTDLYTKENLRFLVNFTNTSQDKGFGVFRANPEKVNQVLGKGRAENMVKMIVSQEEIFPALRKKQANGSIDWKALQAKLVAKYPDIAEELILKGKVTYYQRENDWTNFSSNIMAYMNKYGETVDAGTLNSYAWAVFENCKDMTCVEQALEWSKRSFKDNSEPSFMDTYANLLHKLGKTKEAIEWQKKAIALLTDEESKKEFTQTLSKMEKGEKTWKD